MMSAFSSMTSVMRFKSLFFMLCFSLRMNCFPFQSNIAMPEAPST